MKQCWQLQFCVWKEVTGNIFKSGILLWGTAVPEAREGRSQKPPWGRREATVAGSSRWRAHSSRAAGSRAADTDQSAEALQVAGQG